MLRSAHGNGGIELNQVLRIQAQHRLAIFSKKAIRVLRELLSCAHTSDVALRVDSDDLCIDCP
jgi:hypothetical protein